MRATSISASAREVHSASENGENHGLAFPGIAHIIALSPYPREPLGHDALQFRALAPQPGLFRLKALNLGGKPFAFNLSPLGFALHLLAPRFVMSALNRATEGGVDRGRRVLLFGALPLRQLLGRLAEAGLRSFEILTQLAPRMPCQSRSQPSVTRKPTRLSATDTSSASLSGLRSLDALLYDALPMTRATRLSTAADQLAVAPRNASTTIKSPITERIIAIVRATQKSSGCSQACHADIMAHRG